MEAKEGRGVPPGPREHLRGQAGGRRQEEEGVVRPKTESSADAHHPELALLAVSPCVAQREARLRSSGQAAMLPSTAPHSHSRVRAGLPRQPRDTILSRLREARGYLTSSGVTLAQGSSAGEDERDAEESSGRTRRNTGRTVKGSKASLLAPASRGRIGQGSNAYTINTDGRLEFGRLKDEIKFTSITAAVRSALENHQELRASGDGSRGGALRSFVALVCKDAAKAGGYRLCMRYFGSRLPAAVPWAIDALVRGDTLSRGLQEVLQIGGRRVVLGLVSSALPIGGLPSFLLIGAGWWAVEKGARRLLGLFTDDLGLSSSSRSQNSSKKKKKNHHNKHKAKL